MSSLVSVYISMLFGVVVVLTFEFWLLLQLFFFTCFLKSGSLVSGFAFDFVAFLLLLLECFNWS